MEVQEREGGRENERENARGNERGNEREGPERYFRWLLVITDENLRENISSYIREGIFP